jgi:hypothetical protein
VQKTSTRPSSGNKKAAELLAQRPTSASNRSDAPYQSNPTMSGGNNPMQRSGSPKLNQPAAKSSKPKQTNRTLQVA